MSDVHDLVMTAQADVQTALGVLRMELGQMKGDTIAHVNLSHSETRLDNALDGLHAALKLMGTEMAPRRMNHEHQWRPVGMYDPPDHYECAVRGCTATTAVIAEQGGNVVTTWESNPQ